MVRKFNEETFMKAFTKNFERRFREFGHMYPVISLTRVTIETCRELKYAQWKNREAMTKLVKNWWDSLPTSKDPHWEGASFIKVLFGFQCHLSSASGPTFISIERFSGCNSGDLISFGNREP